MKDFCPESELISACAEGGLAPEEADQVMVHVATCDSCRRELAILQVLPPPTPAPVEVHARTKRAVLAAVDRERISRRLQIARTAQRSYAFVAAAAVLLLAVTAIALMRSRPVTNPDGTGVAKGSPAPTQHPTPPPRPELALDPPPRPRVEAPASPEPLPTEAPRPSEVARPADPTPVIPPVSPEPSPSSDPVAKAEATPSPEPPPVRPRETVARTYEGVRISDFTGDVSIRRNGKKDSERASVVAQVSDGDLVMTEKMSAFFLVGDFPVALMPKSAVTVAREKRSGSLSLTLQAGEAMVDSGGVDGAGWLLSDSRITLEVDQTRAKFSTSIEGKALTLSALAGVLSGRDDLGRPFQLMAGEKLVATIADLVKASESGAAKKREILALARPPERTHFFLEPQTEILEGKVEAEKTPRGENLLVRSAERKGVHSIRLVPKGATASDDLVIRARICTNLQEVRVGLVIKGVPVFADLRIRKDQRRTWIAIEIPFSEMKTAADVLFPARAAVEIFSVTGRQQDVFGDDRGWILLDDLQILDKTQ